MDPTSCHNSETTRRTNEITAPSFSDLQDCSIAAGSSGAYESVAVSPSGVVTVWTSADEEGVGADELGWSGSVAVIASLARAFEANLSDASNGTSRRSERASLAKLTTSLSSL